MIASKYNDIIKVEENKYLLINYLFGNMVIINSKVKDMVSSLPGIDERSSILSELEIANYIFTDSSVEDKKLSSVANTSRKYSFSIVPTYKCNLNCSYCVQVDVRDSKKDWDTNLISEKSINKIFLAIEKIIETDGLSNFNKKISISGGEIFLPGNKKILELLLSKIKSLFCDYEIVFTTNGTNIESFLPILVNHNVSFIISIDGVDAVHDKRRMTKGGTGTFNDIVNSINFIKEHFPIVLKVNLDYQNIDNLPAFADFVISKDWNKCSNIRFALASVLSSKNLNYPFIMDGKALFNKLIEIYRKYPSTRIFKYDSPKFSVSFFYDLLFRSSYKKPSPNVYRCSAPFSYVFDPYGNIYPCTVCDYKIGTYLPNFKLYENKIRKLRARNILNLEKCKNCRYGPVCGGGCLFEADLEKGNCLSNWCPDFDIITKKYVPFLYNEMRKWTLRER